jgi:hypothetical protein
MRCVRTADFAIIVVLAAGFMAIASLSPTEAEQQTSPPAAQVTKDQPQARALLMRMADQFATAQSFRW